MFIIVLQLSVT